MSARTVFLTTALAGGLFAGSLFAAIEYVILEVGDREIKKTEVQSIWEGLFPQGQAPDFDKVEEPIKQNVLRGAISEYLLYEEALDADIDEKDEVEQRVEEARR